MKLALASTCTFNRCCLKESIKMVLHRNNIKIYISYIKQHYFALKVKINDKNNC